MEGRDFASFKVPPVRLFGSKSFGLLPMHGRHSAKISFITALNLLALLDIKAVQAARYAVGTKGQTAQRNVAV